MTKGQTIAEDQNVETSRLPLRAFRYVRNELAIELAVILVCVLLAFGLNFKVSLTVVLACLKFAMPDFVTAFFVLRHDPDKAHGFAVSLLFIASGLSRSAFVAIFTLVFGSQFIIPLMFQLGLGNMIAIGLATGFITAFSFLALVFPLTFVAACISWITKTRLSFAKQLTQLRRAKTEAKRNCVELDVASSLASISVAAMFSIPICLMPVALVADGPGLLLLLLGCFVLPFIWGRIFVRTTTPSDAIRQPGS